ncbi:hypothetical protein quinque_008462 [Culex quinquefasciatus]
MIRLVVLGLVCAVFAEKREFVPSASMDTEGGWRVTEHPIISYNGLSENEPSVYLSFPKLERLSSEVVDSDFLNNDEEFRIKVLDAQEEGRTALQRAYDSIPESSSSYITTSQEEPLEFLSPLRLVQPPPTFKEDPPKSQKFPSFSSSDIKSFSKPRKLYPERFPTFYDSVPEMSNVKNFQQYLAQSDDEYEYIAVPKGSYHKLPKIVEEKPQLYEIDKNARPVILSEEIRYEGLPPFMSPRFPPMPMKMNFPRGGPNMIHRSPPPRSYFKPMPPKRSSIKMKRVVNNSDSLKRAMRSYGGGSATTKGIPLIRGRFQV